MLRAGWPSPWRPNSSRLLTDAFALGADVDQDLVLVDADDLTLDDVAVLEALDVRILLGEELLHRRGLGSELGARASAPPRRRSRRAHRPSRPRSAEARRRRPRIRLRGGRIAGLARRRAPSGAGAVDNSLSHGLGRRTPRRCPWLSLGHGEAQGIASLDPTRRRAASGSDGLRLGGGDGLVDDGGGLVGGHGRDGLLGRLIGDGGNGPRLRRGPAQLFFGQGFGHSWLWICARESRTA